MMKKVYQAPGSEPATEEMHAKVAKLVEEINDLLHDSGMDVGICISALANELRNGIQFLKSDPITWPVNRGTTIQVLEDILAETKEGDDADAFIGPVGKSLGVH